MKNIICNLIVSAAAVLSAVSCSMNADPEVVASRFELTLGKYINEEGQSVSGKWKADDQVALLYVADGGVQKLTASPLMEGRKDGMFMFNWEGYQEGRELVFFCPSDAPVTIEDGAVKVDAPLVQDGSFKTLFIAAGQSNGSSYLDASMTMQQYWHTVHVTAAKGDYVIAKAEFVADQQSFTVQFDTPLDCRKDACKFYINLPPMTVRNGYDLVLTTEEGKTFGFSSSEETVFASGEMTEIKDVRRSAELVVCGDNMIYVVNADKAAAEGFDKAVTWSWDAQSVASVVGGSMIRLDDCKVVDNGTKILATSSYSWVVLLDIQTKELLWWSYSSKNAHSADLLPGGKIAVACSDADNGLGNRVQIFDVNTPNVALSFVPFDSAHGVVWNEATQRLYVGGGRAVNVYTLKDWSSSTPILELEKTIDTSESVTSVHDLTYVDSKTLLVAGRRAALYNVQDGSFTNLPHFSESTSLKSVNYNPVSGACWYTDATKEEYQRPGLSWATNTVFYTSNVATKVVSAEIPVPDGLNMYKVRVKNW